MLCRVVSELLKDIRQHVTVLYGLTEGVSMLDMLVSFAAYSALPGYGTETLLCP